MINISVVLYNTPFEQLKRLYNEVLHSEQVYRLYVIDNSPKPLNDSQLFDSDKLVYIFNNANLGYGRGHNIAIRESIKDGIPYHLVLNADVEFDISILKTMSDYMDSHSDVALLSPKVYYPNGDVQYLCKLLPTPLILIARRYIHSRAVEKWQNKYELRMSGYDKIMNIPYLSGCFMFMRTDALKHKGLFDERYFMYPEDIDLTRRLHQSYKTLFFPEVSIIHHHERASYKNIRMEWIHIVNMCRYFNKWGWFFDHERKQINQRVCNQYLPTS